MRIIIGVAVAKIKRNQPHPTIANVKVSVRYLGRVLLRTKVLITVVGGVGGHSVVVGSVYHPLWPVVVCLSHVE